MPQVIANDTNKASLPVNRLERHAGTLARAVLRGGGDGDTASLPDRPLVPRSRFRQQLSASVAMTSDVCAKKLSNGMGGNPHGFCQGVREPLG
jgi:hypothetical protein